MSEPEGKGGGSGGFIALIVVVALAIGIATAINNSNTPLAKAQRAARESERHAMEVCRNAGCPRECYNAGMC